MSVVPSTLLIYRGITRSVWEDRATMPRSSYAVEVVMPTSIQGGRISVAFGVDDPAGAREALGELAASGSQTI